jgi:predicted amidophosphoribosyltransferase
MPTCKKCGREFRPLSGIQLYCRPCQWTYHRDYQREQYAPIKKENSERKKNIKQKNEQYKKLYELTKIQKDIQLKLKFTDKTEKLKHMARNTMRGIK